MIDRKRRRETLEEARARLKKTGASVTDSRALEELVVCDDGPQYDVTKDRPEKKKRGA